MNEAINQLINQSMSKVCTKIETTLNFYLAEPKLTEINNNIKKYIFQSIYFLGVFAFNLPAVLQLIESKFEDRRPYHVSCKIHDTLCISNITKY